MNLLKECNILIQVNFTLNPLKFYYAREDYNQTMLVRYEIPPTRFLIYYIQLNQEKLKKFLSVFF